MRSDARSERLPRVALDEQRHKILYHCTLIRGEVAACGLFDHFFREAAFEFGRQALCSLINTFRDNEASSVAECAGTVIYEVPPSPREPSFVRPDTK